MVSTLNDLGDCLEIQEESIPCVQQARSEQLRVSLLPVCRDTKGPNRLSSNLPKPSTVKLWSVNPCKIKLAEPRLLTLCFYMYVTIASCLLEG